MIEQKLVKLTTSILNIDEKYVKIARGKQAGFAVIHIDIYKNRKKVKRITKMEDAFIDHPVKTMSSVENALKRIQLYFKCEKMMTSNCSF